MDPYLRYTKYGVISKAGNIHTESVEFSGTFINIYNEITRVI